MKYGLEEQQSQKSRIWRHTMETELIFLKHKLTLKEQELEDCKNKVQQLSEKMSSDSSSSKALLEKIEQIEEKVNKHMNPSFFPASAATAPTSPSTSDSKQFVDAWHRQLKKGLFPSFTPNPFTKGVYWPADLACEQASWPEQGKKDFAQKFETNPFPTVTKIEFWPSGTSERSDVEQSGSHKVPFRPVPTDEEIKFRTRQSCITAMPEYENWSFEELRWQDYNIKNRFTQFNFFSSGTYLTQYKPSLENDVRHGFFGISNVKTRINNITAMPAYMSKSLEELRFEDDQLKRSIQSQVRAYTTVVDKNAPNPSGQIMFGPGRRTKNPADPTEWKITCCQEQKSGLQTEEKTSTSGETEPKTSQPELLQSILSELKGVNEKCSSMEARFTTLESHLSDVSSQVSVMDSKFSSVGMFVTMERFSKKWKALEAKLSTLESPTMQNNPASSSALNDQVCFFQNYFEPRNSLVTEPSPSSESTGIFSFGVQSNVQNATFNFVHPNKNTDGLLFTDGQEKMCTTPLKISQAENGASNDLGKECKSPSINAGNVSDQQNKPLKNQNSKKNINVEVKKSSSNIKDENQTKTETHINSHNQGTPVTEKELKYFESQPQQSETETNVSMILKKSEETGENLSTQLSDKTLPCEEEDGFVVVEKSDFLNSSENSMNVTKSVESTNLSRKFQSFDVTEYLDVASIKKINRRYELGVEATDATLLELTAADNQVRMSIDSTKEKDSFDLSKDFSSSNGTQQTVCDNQTRMSVDSSKEKEFLNFVKDFSSSDITQKQSSPFLFGYKFNTSREDAV